MLLIPTKNKNTNTKKKYGASFLSNIIAVVSHNLHAHGHTKIPMISKYCMLTMPFKAVVLALHSKQIQDIHLWCTKETGQQSGLFWEGLTGTPERPTQSNMYKTHLQEKQNTCIQHNIFMITCPCVSLIPANTHTHTHTYTHTHTHTHTHTQTHMLTQAHTHIQTHTHLQTHLLSCITHTCVHTHIHTHSLTRTHTQKHKIVTKDVTKLQPIPSPPPQRCY